MERKRKKKDKWNTIQKRKKHCLERSAFKDYKAKKRIIFKPALSTQNQNLHKKKLFGSYLFGCSSPMIKFRHFQLTVTVLIICNIQYIYTREFRYLTKKCVILVQVQCFSADT